MKIFMFLIITILWMAIFNIPAGRFGVTRLCLFFNSNKNLVYAVILWVMGLLPGIMIAEGVRKKYGLTDF